MDDALVLTIDRRYFAPTAGVERWLYRVVRKHAGRQSHGWRFEFLHLHAKSASLSPFKRFAFECPKTFPARLRQVKLTRL
jgi:plasmid replication initiation protein